MRTGDSYDPHSKYPWDRATYVRMSESCRREVDSEIRALALSLDAVPALVRDGTTPGISAVLSSRLKPPRAL